MIMAATKPALEETCGDHSMGRNVYAYLEKKLSADETTEFVSHAKDCAACLNTMIMWHYESILAERDALATQTTMNNVWDWRLGSNAQAYFSSPASDNICTETEMFH